MRVKRRDKLGAWLAEAAWLEAASVDAFVRLSQELAFHEAPDELVQRARAAADDERRHARIMAALAERHGGQVIMPAFQVPTCERTLLDIAIENAQQGCVRETLGALVAQWQATHAHDVGIRRGMRIIARDEAEHAELALDVHAWLMSRIDSAGRQQLGQALRLAKSALLSELDAPEATETVRHAAGIPNFRRTKQMLRLTDRLLWAEAA